MSIQNKESVFKAVVKDQDGKDVRMYAERTTMNFNEWKALKAIPTLKPMGEYLEFYIDDVQQFFDDTTNVVRKNGFRET